MALLPSFMPPPFLSLVMQGIMQGMQGMCNLAKIYALGYFFRSHGIPTNIRYERRKNWVSKACFFASYTYMTFLRHLAMPEERRYRKDTLGCVWHLCGTPGESQRMHFSRIIPFVYLPDYTLIIPVLRPYCNTKKYHKGITPSTPMQYPTGIIGYAFWPKYTSRSTLEGQRYRI